jgi:hypothetical protein
MERHAESTAWVPAAPERVFARLDNQRVLSAHMAKGSWMTLGSGFTIELDDEAGRRVGSVMRLSGRVLGIPLGLDEIVTVYRPGQAKVWATLGEPRLLVIGAYRMGFDLAPERQGSRLRVWIDYRQPQGYFKKLLGWILSPLYARWCVRRMTGDARKGV